MTEALLQQLAQTGVVTLTVRVHPHASLTRLKAVLDDGSLKIDLAAPAEDQKANIELIRFLADVFSVPASHIVILSGAVSRLKLVRVSLRHDR